MKQKTGRKLLSFLLTLAMVVGLMPGMGMTAYADTFIDEPAIEVYNYSAGTVSSNMTCMMFYVSSGSTLTINQGVTLTLDNPHSFEFYGDSKIELHGTLAGSAGNDVMWEGESYINVYLSDGAKYTVTGLSCIDGDGYLVYYGYDAATDGNGTVSVKNGSTDVTSASKGYKTTTYTFTATPSDGFKFKNWTKGAGGEVLGTDASIDVTCEQNGQYQVYANFERDKTAQTITAEDVTATYGDTDKSVSGTTTGDGAISYSVKSGDAVTVDEKTGALTIVKAGNAVITVTAAETATYAQATKDVNVTINKAAPTVTAPTAKTLTYNGQKQELVNAGSTEDGTLYYAVTTENKAPTDENLYTTSIPTKTDAGTYYVWYKVVGDENHTDSEHACVTATIAAKDDPKPTPEPAAGIVPVARGHVQNVGNVNGEASGKGVKVGTEGRSLRLESFALDLPKDTEGGIEYRGHIQNVGWDEWVAGGKACGTTGQSLRLEAVQMRLTGKLADTHDVWYRVHAQNFGTLGWAKGGQAAGTAGQALRVESLEVQVLPKGEAPAGHEEGKASYVGAATANVHVQDVGWTGSRSSLEFGTTGQGRRLEAVRVTVPGLPVGGGVSYEVHAQDKGWMPAVADGALAGTTGQAKRLEAVRISLTGDAAKEGNFSVWYRVHSQDYGWLGWAHDGAEAGTSGLSKRAEAIDVQVLPQGQVPRGYDAGKAACVTK